MCLRIVPGPDTKGAATSTEVLEIAAGGGQKGCVASDSDDTEVDYLQGEDSEIMSSFSGKLWELCYCEETGAGLLQTTSLPLS